MGGGILWQKKLLGPGPTKLIGGNESTGFYGEVPADELITGDELASKIGLIEGISQCQNEPWLKFSYLGNIEFIAKKPLRYSLIWEDFDSIDAVRGNKVIIIGGLKYKVRLIKGKTEGKQNDTSHDEGSINHNSEWNKLMLPISENAPNDWGKYFGGNVKSPTEDWGVNYSEDDLGAISRLKGINGCNTICQEFRYMRGGSAVRGSIAGSSMGGSDGVRYVHYGWRPVLELVGEVNLALEAKDKLQIQFGNGAWFNGDGVAPNIGRDIKTMPTTVEGYKVTITWKSSNLNIMTNDGKRVGKGDVSLIATIRDNNGDTETKEFKLIII